jgi:hypothetical protein
MWSAFGGETAYAFKPVKMHKSDFAKLMAVSFAMLSALAHTIDGPLPDVVFTSVAHSVFGVFGLGVRRGRGEMCKKHGLKKLTKYIDEDGSTLPSSGYVSHLTMKINS